MHKVNTYLNFNGKTEEAFNFYKSVFGGEFEGGFMRFGDVPSDDKSMEAPSEDVKNLIMHVSLPIMDGHRLMGTDAVEAMGFTVKQGNMVYISLHPDTKEEADRLFNELSAGGKVEMEMQDTFWGDYYGSFTDKFGIGWMVDYAYPKKQG